MIPVKRYLSAELHVWLHTPFAPVKLFLLYFLSSSMPSANACRDKQLETSNNKILKYEKWDCTKRKECGFATIKTWLQILDRKLLAMCLSLGHNHEYITI